MVSTTPTELSTWPTPTTTNSSGTGLEASRLATAPAPTQRLSHALGGPANPSRHMSAVSAVTGPLPKSPEHGFGGNNVSAPQLDKGKGVMVMDNQVDLLDGLGQAPRPWKRHQNKRQRAGTNTSTRKEARALRFDYSLPRPP